MISVVIPVYHSVNTLRMCVESLRKQTYREIEIIIVVERAPDPSGELADELAGEDKRIKVIHQDNRGVSFARNTGIRAASGEYIQFLDSDDYLEPGACLHMLKAMEDNSADMVIAGFHHMYFGRDVLKLPTVQGSFEISSAGDIVIGLYRDQYLNMPWNKLYKKALIQKYFPEDRNLGEDLIFNLSYMRGIGRFAVIRKAVCNYIQDDRGTTLSTKKRMDRIETALRLYTETADFCRAVYKEISEEQKRMLLSKVAVEFLDNMESIAFEKGISCKEALSVLRKHKKAWDSISSGKRPILGALDYKIIYTFFNSKMFLPAYFLIQCRGIAVRIYRRFL